jgi:hypothetical protein
MTNLKRGTRVTYTFAAGKVVPGKVLRPYAKDMPDWYLVELTDEQGTSRGGCHSGQLTVVDNR